MALQPGSGGGTRRGVVGLTLTVAVVLVAFVGPFVVPYPATSFETAPFAARSSSFLLGGDVLGRDVLSRILDGGWEILLMAAAAAAFGVVVGATCGIAAAYLRGKTDGLIMRSVDVILAFPQLVFALLLVSIIGPKVWLIIVAVGLTHAPQVARVIRSATLDISERDFVKATELQGVPPARVMTNEILPNLVTPLMVETGLRMTYSIVIIAGLSYLGFGIPPPAPSWGVDDQREPDRAGLQYVGGRRSGGTDRVADDRDEHLHGCNRSRLDWCRGPRSAGCPCLIYRSRRRGVTAEEIVIEAAKGDSAGAAARLSVRKLRICLGTAKGPDVVDDVSFDVVAGEVLGLVGESGSGKTSVALALLGYARRGLAIASGEVLLDGVNLLALDEKRLRMLRGLKVAYVPQDPASALNPALRIETQLNEAMSTHPGALDDVAARRDEVLEEVRFPHRTGPASPVPAPTVGGTATAGCISNGLCLPAEPDCPGRADHRTGRHNATSRPRDRSQPLPGLRRGRGLCQPRPRHSRRPRLLGGGHVRRADSGARPHRADIREPGPPLYTGIARHYPFAGPVRGVARYGRSTAQARAAAQGLLVRPGGAKCGRPCVPKSPQPRTSLGESCAVGGRPKWPPARLSGPRRRRIDPPTGPPCSR